ncbi:MAG: transposase [Tannerellaceae bacterium]
MVVLQQWSSHQMHQFGDNNLNRILDTFENHNITIINYFDKRLTNASAEWFNAKIKALRFQFRWVSDIKFFMYRLTKLYA